MSHPGNGLRRTKSFDDHKPNSHVAIIWAKEECPVLHTKRDSEKALIPNFLDSTTPIIT